MRKGASLILALSMVMLFVFGNLEAVQASDSFGVFPYWYDSTSNDIGMITSSSMTIKKNQNSGFGLASTKFDTIITNSVRNWPLVNHSFPISQATGQSDFDAGPGKILGVSRAEANAANIPSDAAGATVPYMTLVGYGTYAGVEKSVYQISGFYMMYIWDTSNTIYKTSSFTDAQWQNVASHEFGHAIGYLGHSASSSDLLWYGVTSLGAPTTRDKNHMRNVYTIN